MATRLVAGSLPWRPSSDPRAVHMGFVVQWHRTGVPPSATSSLPHQLSLNSGGFSFIYPGEEHWTHKEPQFTETWSHFTTTRKKKKLPLTHPSIGDTFLHMLYLRCLVRIVVSCLVCIFEVVLIVLLSSYVYLLYYVYIAVLL